MAVSIDTVYQRVLGIINKEQRGYITPQEFNLLANQAQMDIFEQYFYDLNAFKRQGGNDSTYSDMVDIINEKIDIFEKYRTTVNMTTEAVGALPSYYRMGELYYLHSGGYVEVEKIQQNEIHHIQNSPLTAPTLARPVYVNTSGSAIQIYPITIISGVTCNYISKPTTVNWSYTLVNDYPLYNSTNSVNFSLHDSEETDLVIKILALSGVILNDPNAYQLASAEDAKNQQQENK